MRGICNLLAPLRKITTSRGNAYSLAAGQCDVCTSSFSREWDGAKNSGQCAFSVYMPLALKFWPYPRSRYALEHTAPWTRVDAFVMTMTHDVCLRHRMLPRETTMRKKSMQSVICTWLSLQTDYAIRPSWTPLCRGVNNCRNSPAKSGRLIGCAPGHQVTPRLHALFHTGASGDSLPLHAFLRMAVKWLLTFVRRGIKDPSPSCILLRRGMRWLLAPRGSHIALNEWVSGVLCTR